MYYNDAASQVAGIGGEAVKRDGEATGGRGRCPPKPRNGTSKVQQALSWIMNSKIRL